MASALSRGTTLPSSRPPSRPPSLPPSITSLRDDRLAKFPLVSCFKSACLCTSVCVCARESMRARERVRACVRACRTRTPASTNEHKHSHSHDTNTHILTHAHTHIQARGAGAGPSSGSYPTEWGAGAGRLDKRYPPPVKPTAVRGTLRSTSAHSLRGAGLRAAPIDSEEELASDENAEVDAGRDTALSDSGFDGWGLCLCPCLCQLPVVPVFHSLALTNSLTRMPIGVCMYARMHACVHVCMNACVCACVHVCMNA